LPLNDISATLCCSNWYFISKSPKVSENITPTDYYNIPIFCGLYLGSIWKKNSMLNFRNKCFWFSPLLNGEATNTSFIVFSLTRPRIKLTIFCTPGKHTNNYTTMWLKLFGQLLTTCVHTDLSGLNQKHLFLKVNILFFFQMDPR
jgi:hypothetical protein